jgi:hypothetical protein
MSILEAFVLYGLALPFFAIALEASSLGSRLCMEAGYGVDTGRRTWARSAYRVQIEHELFGIVKLYAVTMHLCPNVVLWNRCNYGTIHQSTMPQHRAWSGTTVDNMDKESTC